MPTERNTEPVASLARLEEAVNGIRGDLAEMKASQAEFVRAVDHRVSMLADVRVAGLEQREIRRQAIEDERARATDAAREAAERAAAHAEKQGEQKVTRRQFWIGTGAISGVTLLGSLIASGQIHL